MLDLRSQRDPNDTLDGPDKSILGIEQKAWLKDGLLNSTARGKFLMSLVPFNPGTKPQDGRWAFQAERANLINFIQEYKITSVIVISRDIHSGEALDDGAHSDFPELSVPHANMAPSECWATETPGAWSEGILCGIDSRGYALATVAAAAVAWQARRVEGSVGLSLVVTED
jgi:PhoD-like phosphatase